MISKFEINKKYEMIWPGDSSLRSYFKVLKRTAKTVTIECLQFKIVKTLRIKIYDNSEVVKPTGNYSLAPVLKAKRQVN